MTDNTNISAIVRHPQYYLENGDFYVLADKTMFRIHSYFFSRDSTLFHKKLNPASPGDVKAGTNDNNPYILDGISPTEFEKLLLVFYNPKYSLYDVSLEDIRTILNLANKWEFKEVKEFAVGELHKNPGLDLVEKMALYIEYEVDPRHVIPLYSELCKRDTPLTVDETRILGIESAVLVNTARERLRADPSLKSRSPLPTTQSIGEIYRTIEFQMGIDPETMPLPSQHIGVLPIQVSHRFKRPSTTMTPTAEDFVSMEKHANYYIPTGDLFIIVQHIQFRVHRYFFERESQWFAGKLASLTSPAAGAKLPGTDDSNAIILQNCTAEEFARFLWVFYNPKYALYDAEISDWKIILRLSVLWDFPEVKALAIRELELNDIPDAKRIKMYTENKVDPDILLRRYISLCKRDERLTVDEGYNLGMDVAMRIASTREIIRSPDGGKSPLTPTMRENDLIDVIRKAFSKDDKDPNSDTSIIITPIKMQPPPLKIQTAKRKKGVPTEDFWMSGQTDSPFDASVPEGKGGEIQKSFLTSAHDTDERIESKELKATTSWIAAAQALQHVKDNMSLVAEVFSRCKIQESEYTVHAGFDEKLIQAGIGYLEQIHVFTSSNVVDTSFLLSELARIFSPFSTILFTESASYYIPVIKGDGSVWHFEDFVQATASRFILGSSATAIHPTVISIPQQSALLGNSFQGNCGDIERNESEPKPSNKGKEQDSGEDDKDHSDEHGENNENDENPDEDPEEPNPTSNGSNNSAKISFNIVSNIYSSQSNEPNIFQTLTMEGALTIQTTPLNAQIPDEFAKCRLQFLKLRFGTERSNSSMAYSQFHLRIVMDPEYENSDVDEIRPEQTTAFEREMLESSATNTTRATGGSIGGSVGLKPQATLMASANQTNETGLTSARKRYMSRITQHSILGVVWWGFNIEDPYEQERGIKMEQNFLPTAKFEFLGDNSDDVPAPPPSNVKLEVASYWSIMPQCTSQASGMNWIYRLLSTSKTPTYSNICQIVALGVPTNLAKRSDYRATIPVKLGCNKSQYHVNVRHQTGAVEFVPAISWGQDPASVESDNLRRLSILSLPTLTTRRLGDSNSDSDSTSL